MVTSEKTKPLAKRGDLFLPDLGLDSVLLIRVIWSYGALCSKNQYPTLFNICYCSLLMNE
jgi:hypothetical protein